MQQAAPHGLLLPLLLVVVALQAVLLLLLLLLLLPLPLVRRAQACRRQAAAPTQAWVAAWAAAGEGGCRPDRAARCRPPQHPAAASASAACPAASA